MLVARTNITLTLSKRPRRRRQRIRHPCNTRQPLPLIPGSHSKLLIRSRLAQQVVPALAAISRNSRVHQATLVRTTRKSSIHRRLAWIQINRAQMIQHSLEVWWKNMRNRSRFSNSSWCRTRRARAVHRWTLKLCPVTAAPSTLKCTQLYSKQLKATKEAPSKSKRFRKITWAARTT